MAIQRVIINSYWEAGEAYKDQLSLQSLGIEAELEAVDAVAAIYQGMTCYHLYVPLANVELAKEVVNQSMDWVQEHRQLRTLDKGKCTKGGILYLLGLMAIGGISTLPAADLNWELSFWALYLVLALGLGWMLRSLRTN